MTTGGCAAADQGPASIVVLARPLAHHPGLATASTPPPWPIPQPLRGTPPTAVTGGATPSADVVAASSASSARRPAAVRGGDLVVALDLVRLGGGDTPSLAGTIHAPKGDTESADVTTTTGARQCRALSTTEPLRLWVGGDSLAGSLGPSLGKLAGATGVVQPYFDSRVSSGLRPIQLLRLAHARHHRDGPAQPGSGGVHHRHQRLDRGVGRLEGGVRRQGRLDDEDAHRAGAHRVRWLECTPTLKDAGQMDAPVVEVNAVAQEVAKRHPKVHYVDTYKLFSDTDGTFSYDLPDEQGMVRSPCARATASTSRRTAPTTWRVRPTSSSTRSAPSPSRRSTARPSRRSRPRAARRLRRARSSSSGNSSGSSNSSARTTRPATSGQQRAAPSRRRRPRPPRASTSPPTDTTSGHRSAARIDHRPTDDLAAGGGTDVDPLIPKGCVGRLPAMTDQLPDAAAAVECAADVIAAATCAPGAQSRTVDGRISGGGLLDRRTRCSATISRTRRRTRSRARASCARYGEHGEVESLLARAFVADAIARPRARLLGRERGVGRRAAPCSPTRSRSSRSTARRSSSRSLGDQCVEARLRTDRTSPTTSSSSPTRSTASPRTRSVPSPSTSTAPTPTSRPRSSTAWPRSAGSVSRSPRSTAGTRAGVRPTTSAWWSPPRSCRGGRWGWAGRSSPGPRSSPVPSSPAAPTRRSSGGCRASPPASSWSV